MTNNELITELVNYDGWDITHEIHKPLFNTYLTDMNILHRIAVKVVREVFSLNVDNDDYTKDMDIREVKSWIDMSMYNYPNDKGEHLQLAEAIVNAIRYISANKA